MVLQVIRLLIPLTCTCPWSVWFCHLLEIYRVYIVRSLIYPRLRFLSWKIVDKCKQASCWSCKLPTNEDSANSVFFMYLSVLSTFLSAYCRKYMINKYLVLSALKCAGAARHMRSSSFQNISIQGRKKIGLVSKSHFNLGLQMICCRFIDRYRDLHFAAG